MRIIHTSDWHLGQNFYTKSRAPEHQAFFKWLLDVVVEHNIDAIIVAGDIFDTGSPPSYARELYNHFVVQLRQTGCQLIILAGNHDAVSTLNESKELLACLNTQVIASAAKDVNDQAILLKTKEGLPGAILCPIPFLRPRDIQYSEAGLSGQEKQHALMTAIAAHYQQCYENALLLRGDQALPIILTGHLTTVGATTSESVRDIYIGSLDAFPSSAFPPADYIALGHIHRAQKIGNHEHIRYSGSPIALSFDEVQREKSIFIVNFTDDQLISIDTLPIPITQPLMTIKGSPTEITEKLAKWSHSTPDDQKVWLDIELNTDEYLHDVQRELQNQAAHLPVEILLIRRSRSMRERVFESAHNETLSTLQPDEVFDKRLEHEALDEPQTERLRQLFQHTLTRIFEQESP